MNKDFVSPDSQLSHRHTVARSILTSLNSEQFTDDQTGPLWGIADDAGMKNFKKMDSKFGLGSIATQTALQRGTRAHVGNGC